MKIKTLALLLALLMLAVPVMQTLPGEGFVSAYADDAEDPVTEPERTLTPEPTEKPTPAPTEVPTSEPTIAPEPTEAPTSEPVVAPEPTLTAEPEDEPTATPEPIPPVIDTSRDASFSPAFVQGWVEIAQGASLFAKPGDGAFGTVSNGIGYALSRQYPGQRNDCLLVAYAADDAVQTAYISAEKLRPLAEEKIEAYLLECAYADGVLFYKDGLVQPLPLLPLTLTLNEMTDESDPGLVLSDARIQLAVGETYSLTYDLLPGDDGLFEVEWFTSDAEIATVQAGEIETNQNVGGEKEDIGNETVEAGIVTAVAEGTVEIAIRSIENESVMAICMVEVLSITPRASTVSVDTFEAFQAQVAAYASATEDMTIVVTENLVLPQPVTIPTNGFGDYSLTIKGDDATRTLARGFVDPSPSSGLLIVSGGAKLILQDIIIDGEKNAYTGNAAPLVYVTYTGGSIGTLTLNMGAVLRNNYAERGGGVYVNYSNFIMNGGKVSENESERFGGGVYLSTGDFTMNSGEISGNANADFDSGGGVYMNGGSLTMNGGKISGNTTESNGGGVYVSASGTISMTGGEISGNTAYSGGGVYVGNNGTVTMSGGKISGNDGCDGGGVYLKGTRLTMNAGEISGNAAAYDGGGVYVSTGGTLSMSGGEISGNTATFDGCRGGGVYLLGSYASLFMTGGKISGNTAALDGGGVLVDTSASITLGGTAIVKGNHTVSGGIATANNVYLVEKRYISLDTGSDAPAPGMDVGVTAETEWVSLYNVIVNSGASVAHVAYFHADDPDKIVEFISGRLRIVNPLWRDFYSKVDAYGTATADVTITVSQDMVLPWIVNIPANYNGATLTIKGDGVPHTLTSDLWNTSSNDGLFMLPSNAKLVLEEIVIDGGENYSSTPLVRIDGGTLIMNDGAVLRNSEATMGGGVFIYSGSFTMTGGEVSGNIANGNGGGVYIYNGSFTMTGGTISGNTATASGSGGGVYVSNGTFTMTGGTISGNTATNSGGGVHYGGGTFILGGTAVIKGNTMSTGTTVASNNVRLYSSGRYITLGTGSDAPSSNMEVWVWAADRGTIVNSGASEAHVANFHSDDPGMTVVYGDGSLSIMDLAMEDFYAQVAAYATATNDVVITVTGDLTLRRTLTIPANAGKTLTIKSDGTTRTLTRGFRNGSSAGGLFVLPDNTKLVVEGIIIDGAKDTYTTNYAPLVRVSGGTLIMNDGAVLQNNRGANGGGVYVYSGTFTMKGGMVNGNELYDTSGNGGGVYVSGGTFAMTGGTINGNACGTGGNGGGVYVTSGTFTMTGGTISGNACGASYNGGGVYVNSGTFTLGGTAKILDNAKGISTTAPANNVYLANNRYIALSTTAPPASGMEVWVTTARADGVFVNSGATAGQEAYFYADDASKIVAHNGGQLIIGDSAVEDFYAQVAAYAATTNDVTITVTEDLTLKRTVTVPANGSGATLTIKGNVASRTLTRGFSDLDSVNGLFMLSSGANLILEDIIVDGKNGDNMTLPLIRINGGGALTMNPGAVLRNSRSDGVYAIGGTFTMTGGEINGNTASGGSGVCVGSGSTFIMTGGTIRGNPDSGVYVRNGTFTMTGGKISGNVANGDGGGVYVISGTFTMTGGEISGNRCGSSYNGGGVYMYSNAFTLGGTAVVKDNTDRSRANNVYLASDKYITLGTGDDAPAPGMEVWVHTYPENDVIVNSGASAGQAMYFHADDASKTVVHEGAQLKLVTPAAGIDIGGATVTQSGTLTYNGSAQTPAFTVVVNGTTLTPGVDYTVSGSQINAGTYTGASAATIRGIGGYWGAASGSWSIAKANPALGTHYTSDIAVARTYDGGAKAVTVTASGSYTGLGAATLTYTGTGGTTYGQNTAAPVDAGSYTVRVTFAGGANFNAVTTAVQLGTMTVVKAAAPTGVDQTYYVVNNNARNYDFDLTTLLPDVSPLSLGTVTYAVESVLNGDGVLVTVPSGAVASPLSLNVANVANAGKTAILTMVISSTNYSNFTADITVETEGKIPVTISAIMSGGVYNGNSYDYTGATVKNSANDQPVTGLLPEALYESTDGGGYSSATAPVNAGAYKLTLSIPASDPDYCGSEVFSFAITPQMVVVKADDKTITRGDALPALTVSYSGFIGPDNEANALASQATARFNVANSNTAGISTIDFATQAVLNGTNGANYTLDHQNGTLTVNLNIGDISALAVDPGYLMLGKSDSDTLTAWINGEPVPAAIPVIWNSSNESVAIVADGMVTAIGAGSCYVTAAVTADGEKYSASALVDVVDDTPAGRDIERAHLTLTTVTVNVLSNVGAEVGLVYETKPEVSRQLNSLQSRAPTMSSPVTMDGYRVNLLNDKGGVMAPALKNEIDCYLSIQLSDDCTVEIVRNSNNIGLIDFTKAKASYKFRIELEHAVTGHKITIPEALTVKIDKKAPVIKATAHKFNTFFDNQKLPLILTSANGRVTGVTVQPINKPDWIELNGDMTISLITSAYNAYTKKPTSAKLGLMVTVEGYAPVPFTLSISAARTMPGLKLSATSVPVMSDAALSQGIELRLLPKSAKDTLAGIGVISLDLDDSTYEINTYNPATGDFTLAVKQGETPVAKTLTLQAHILGTEQTIPLTLKTTLYAATKAPTIKASAGTVTLNTELGTGNDVAVVRLTPTPADFSLNSLSISVKEGKVDAPSDVLDIHPSTDGRSVTITTYASTPAGKTYTVTLQTAEVFGAAGKQVPAKVSITVKTLAAGKGAVTATISVNGKLNTTSPESTIVITPKFKNYNGTIDATAFTITGTDSKKNPIVGADSWFILNANGDGSFTLGIDSTKWAQGFIKPEYKYAIRLAQGTAIGAMALSKDASANFTVAQGSVKFTQSLKTVTLYKANPHSSAIMTIYADNVPLPDSARVVIDKATSSPFEILPLGNGQYALQFKGYVPAAKAGTVKLNVYLEGNYDPAADGVGAKANGSVSVSVKLN